MRQGISPAMFFLFEKACFDVKTLFSPCNVNSLLPLRPVAGVICLYKSRRTQEWDHKNCSFTLRYAQFQLSQTAPTQNGCRIQDMAEYVRVNPISAIERKNHLLRRDFRRLRVIAYSKTFNENITLYIQPFVHLV